ncbi:MAG: DUF2283 domain-containing protein [Desulfurococcus sp.]|nr:DUF2283 domain-containing protein [Desulfurococcus sp.]
MNTASTRRYYIENPERISFEYDQLSDTLYMNFEGYEEEADEEILSEDGDIAFRIKNGRILSIMVLNLSRRIPLSSQ